jgi:glycosyltransferase involved in cell wall biosynthesis
MSSETKPTLFLFNLEVDSQSSVLAAGLDWIVAFSDHCKKVFVFSTHVGDYKLPSNVTVIELSGSGFLRKLRWFANNTRAIFVYLSTKGEKIVFHHMSQYTVIFPGIFLKIFRARQGLWYAHAAKGIMLYLAERISNKTFTSATGAFPIVSKKLTLLGQGVETSKFRAAFQKNIDNKRDGIFSLGRINLVKNLEKLVESIPAKHEIRTEFMGRCEDELYRAAIEKLAKEKGLNLVINGVKAYSEIPMYLTKWTYYYCGTNTAVDKSAIEAAASGCIIISTNENVLNLTGMNDIYNDFNLRVPKNLFDQIDFFDKLTNKEISLIRNKISELSCKRNNVVNTTYKIVDILCAT